MPRDPWNTRWECGAIGIEFLDDRTVRPRLPDDAAVKMELPAVHQSVVLPTPSHVLPDDDHDNYI